MSQEAEEDRDYRDRRSRHDVSRDGRKRFHVWSIFLLQLWELWNNCYSPQRKMLQACLHHRLHVVREACPQHSISIFDFDRQYGQGDYPKVLHAQEFFPGNDANRGAGTVEGGVPWDFRASAAVVISCRLQRQLEHNVQLYNVLVIHCIVQSVMTFV